MKALHVLIAAFAIALAGCVPTVSRYDPSPPAQTQIVQMKRQLYDAELAFNLALRAVDAAATAGRLQGNDALKAMALVQSGHASLTLARAYVAANDPLGLAVELGKLQQSAAALTSLSTPKVQ